MKSIAPRPNQWNITSVLVDDDDYERLNQFKWYIYHNGGGNLYATRFIWTNGKSKTIFMHRDVMNAPKGRFVDYKNRDGLDNRKENLRFVTRLQNATNSKLPVTNTSGYRGVRWAYKSWQAVIKQNGQATVIDYFDNKRHAALAYDIWAKELHGEFAQLKFLAG